MRFHLSQYGPAKPFTPGSLQLPAADAGWASQPETEFPAGDAKTLSTILSLDMELIERQLRHREDMGTPRELHSHGTPRKCSTLRDCPSFSATLSPSFKPGSSQHTQSPFSPPPNFRICPSFAGGSSFKQRASSNSFHSSSPPSPIMRTEHTDSMSPGGSGYQSKRHIGFEAYTGQHETRNRLFELMAESAEERTRTAPAGFMAKRLPTMRREYDIEGGNVEIDAGGRKGDLAAKFKRPGFLTGEKLMVAALDRVERGEKSLNRLKTGVMSRPTSRQAELQQGGLAAEGSCRPSVINVPSQQLVTHRNSSDGNVVLLSQQRAEGKRNRTLLKLLPGYATTTSSTTSSSYATAQESDTNLVLGARRRMDNLTKSSQQYIQKKRNQMGASHIRGSMTTSRMGARGIRPGSKSGMRVSNSCPNGRAPRRSSGNGADAFSGTLLPSVWQHPSGPSGAAHSGSWGSSQQGSRPSSRLRSVGQESSQAPPASPPSLGGPEGEGQMRGSLTGLPPADGRVEAATPVPEVVAVAAVPGAPTRVVSEALTPSVLEEGAEGEEGEHAEPAPKPRLPPPLDYSGAFGRVESFSKRLQAAKKGLVMLNPTAFSEDFATQAEVDIRAGAYKAQQCLQEVVELANEPKVIQVFKTSVKMLSVQRPYFKAPTSGVRPHYAPPSCLSTAIPAAAGKGSRAAAAPSSSFGLWSLEQSVFAPRRMEPEARDFYDSEQLRALQFQVDWDRLIKKKRLHQLLLTEMRSNLSSAESNQNDDGLDGKRTGLSSAAKSIGGLEAREEAEDAETKREWEARKLPVLLNEMKEVMMRYRDVLRSLFTHYCMRSGPLTSEEAFEMNRKQWMGFTTAAGLVNPALSGAHTVDMGRMFSEVFQSDSKHLTTPVASASDDCALSRFEFYEAVLLVALNRAHAYQYDSVTHALSVLVDRVIFANVPPTVYADSNDFRRNKLYESGMSSSVAVHLPLLQAMFKLYTSKDFSRTLWIEHWSALLKDCQLLGTASVIEESSAKLIFAQSQLAVSDELKQRRRAVSLTFWDFVEAVARLSEVLFPTKKSSDIRMLSPSPLGAPAARPAQCADTSGAGAGAAPTAASAVAQSSAPVPAASVVESRSESPMGTISSDLLQSFETTIDLMVIRMSAEWGGSSEASCAAAMLTLAEELTEGVVWLG